MSCLKKKHVRQKAKMQHPSNLDSFMDETDREVMNLTDRAFKSLCVSDEAIYNDSEILLSPVDFNKSLHEEVTKKPCENPALDFKKHKAYQSNCVYNTQYQMKNTSTVSSLLAAFAGEKTNDPKITNGDSWDKSALLSLQTELSDFSLDYQNHLINEHSDQVKSHRKPSEKGKNKSIKDIFNLTGKSAKNQHSKSAKLKKLNSVNFFLHSEFSPFQTWEDLNRFGLDNMELFPCYSPAGFYESPIYQKINNSNRLHVPELNKKETSQSTSPPEHQDKSKPHLSQYASRNLKTVPIIQENHSELNFLQLPDIKIETDQPQMLFTSSGSFQRCQSEGDICAPWRKSRNLSNKSKGVIQPFICSPACERSKIGEQGATQNKQEVKTMDEGTCLNSTPFNISQLLTPVIPSRQETGTSEILQSVQSPTALNLPALHETKIHLSPDFKREDYKSKASSLLFNLKDNRKRVKATYSPPKFKGLDAVDQAKLSPLTEHDVTENALKNLEIADSKNMLTVQKTSMYTKSPVTTDFQGCQFSGHINSTLPDDFLGLSLLLAENKGSKKNPLTKATYPSLNMYPKSSSGEFHTEAISVEVPIFHPTVNKSSEQKISKDYLSEINSKDSQTKHNLTKPEINNADHEYTHQNQFGTADKAPIEKTNVVLKEKYPILNECNAQEDRSSRHQDKLNTEEIFTTKEKSHIKESQPKHKFSAQLNNYIKNQRYVNIGNDEDESEYWQEDVISAKREGLKKNKFYVHVQKDNRNLQESKNYIGTNDAFTTCHYSHPFKKDLGIEQGAIKNDALSMRGNTSAKIELFTFKEKPYNSVTDSMNKNKVKDKYELATVALEKRIAEKEQRKKQSDRQPGQDFSMKKEFAKESMLTSGQNATAKNVIPGSQEQKAISNSTATSQKGQSMSYININHNNCHLNKLKLDEPCQQENTTKHSTSRLTYTDRKINDRHGQKGENSKNKSLGNVTKLKETVDTPVSKDELDKSIQEKAIRDRAYSLSENRAMNERQRKEDEGGLDEILHKVRKSDIPKDKGPVTGRVSSLKRKVNKEQEVPSIIVRECSGQVDYSKNDLFNEKSKHITDFPKDENISTNQKKREKNADVVNQLSKKESKFIEQNKEKLENINKCVTIQEEDRDVTSTNNQNASDILRKTDSQTTLKCHGKGFAKKYLSDHFEKSKEPSHDSTVSTLSNNDVSGKITLHDLLVGGKQLEHDNLPFELSEDCHFSHKTDGSPFLNVVEERKCETLDTINSYFDYNPESKLHNLDLAVHPPKDVEKGGWVHCLTDSAHSLSPTCHSNVSSPTLEKPALFKVKDNTFRASPVTKSLRPLLYKSVAGVTQPWSPKESLSGSEKGEEDLFKQKFEVQSPTLPITQPKQSSIQVVHPPSSQNTTGTERKVMTDSSTVKEEEKWQVAIRSVSDEIASFDICANDTVVELAINPIPPDSIQESKEPSERADSACSGIENLFQGKPPAVPPKTEKAMRRAMKLTTKRIQKAESKSKSDRGRSSEKGSCQKRERRHHSSDKVFSDRSYQREHSIDRGSNNHSTDEDSSETSLPKSHTSKRNARQYDKTNSHQNEDSSRKKQHSCLISIDRDAQSSVTKKQNEIQFPQKDPLDAQKINSDCERTGHTSKKYLPQKLYRRAHSLDRFSSGKYEHSIPGSKIPTSKTNTETLEKLTTAETAPLPQNSIEHAHGSSANNMVSQSFPMTQRKLLQDLDSGQYFVVDMPVQVKTKTFFDPETGSYVQLPVQSLEGSVPRAQSVEVVNGHPLMLYHGFVPVSVSSLP
ncbi:hypothetical protein Baya_0469 [Bagarius yarrelli]|uniref:DUF4585 domain-containing protein n=1 Tax=Bagarius yarrelli TaxID=175774 RepID=A0A556TIC9_BAGYA|nr:hypothetical protein Baya_0469 [Bagarius yarrelli]